MNDREKVIKGLEIHTKPNSRCVGCPYPNNGLCRDQLYHDALILLKEQEKRIKDLEEKLRIDIPLKERNENFDLYDTPIFGFHD